MIERNGGVAPIKIQTDKGSEFLNADVRKYLNSMGVNQYTGHGDNKASVVERFNRTWQRYFNMYVTQKGRFPEKLQEALDLVSSNYNRRPHRGIYGLRCHPECGE